MSGSRGPDEPVRIVEVAELADHLHPDRLLRLHELAVEQVDQDIALSGMQRVLTKLDDRRPAHSGQAASALALWEDPREWTSMRPDG
jgi:hypothetical protein